MNYSVLMSVYYKEKAEFLKASIESVMSQTIIPDDFVIICDGKLTDELYKALDFEKKKYQCLNIVQKEKNEGLGPALSFGLSFTKNEIVMRMDSDDLCLPLRAEKQLPLMSEYDLVGGWISEFEGEPNNIIGIRRVPMTFDEIYDFSIQRNPFNHPSTMFKKSIILSAGGYLPLLYVEDYYLWLRVLKITRKVINIQEVLVNMRSGKIMRARRGGKEYRKSLKCLRQYMLKNKTINRFKYLYLCLKQNVFLMLPLSWKDKAYKVMLRK